MVTAVAGGLGRALDVLDGARRALLRRLGRVSAIAALRRRRELRLTAVALSSIALAFVLALVATLPLLALSPLLLGVPHVASDVRYLLVRPLCGPGLPARAWRPVSALFVLAVGLGVAGEGRLALLAAGGAVLVAGLSTQALQRRQKVFPARSSMNLTMVAQPAHGQGFATEAVGSALAWAETRFPTPRTVCLIDPDNHASLRVAAKCGYREVTRVTYKGLPTLLMER